MLQSQADLVSILKTILHPHPDSQIFHDIDFKSVFAIASNQNLLPLIYNAASEYPGFTEFDEAHPEYMMTTMRLMGTQVQNTSEFLNLYREFLKSDITPVVVKGIVCRSLYGELKDFRLSGDEDILVEKKDYEAAFSVLSSCGFHSNDVVDNSLSAVQEVTFYNEETGLTVELHLNPFGETNKLRSKMNTWFRGAFSTTETLEVDGVNLRVLSPTDNLLFLLFHAFKHFLSAGMGIRMALDILLCMEKYQDCIDWVYIRKALEDVKGASFTADLIAVGNKYLGFDLSIEGLNKPVSPDELMEDMLCMGTFGLGSQVDADASRFTEAAIEGKSSNKAADVLHLIFPSWKQWRSLSRIYRTSRGCCRLNGVEGLAVI